MRYLTVITLLFMFFLASCENRDDEIEVKKTIEMIKDEKYDLKTVMNFEDAAKNRVKKIYENDIIQLHELNLAPGENIPVHKSGKRIIYSKNNSNISFTSTRGKSHYKLKQGETQWQENTVCRLTNSGKNDAQLLICTRKDKNLPVGELMFTKKNLQNLAPDLTKNIFENDYFTVSEVNVPSYSALPKHYSNYMLVYPFDNCRINIKKVDTRFEKFKAYWYKPDNYEMKNQSDKDIKFLVFQINK